MVDQIGREVGLFTRKIYLNARFSPSFGGLIQNLVQGFVLKGGGKGSFVFGVFVCHGSLGGVVGYNTRSTTVTMPLVG